MLKMLQYRQSSFLAFLLYPASKLSRGLWWWGEKRKEILQLCLWNLNSTCNSPLTPLRLSCQISGNEGTPENFSVPQFFMWRSLVLWIPPKTYDVRNRSWFCGTFAFNSYCRAPFNLVVGLLARMFLGFFNHFLKMHQTCWILGCDFCFSRQTLVFWTFYASFSRNNKKKRSLFQQLSLWFFSCIRNKRNLVYLLHIFRAEQSTLITLREQVEAMPLISLKFALKQT